MTAWTSAEKWTLLRGFILLSAEIQGEQQNDERYGEGPGQEEFSQKSNVKDGYGNINNNMLLSNY